MSDKRPNVLLICVDHWSAEHFGSVGHTSVMTPGLDEIMNCGACFGNVRTPIPVITGQRFQ